jgi:hypothetical protein
MILSTTQFDVLHAAKFTGYNLGQGQTESQVNARFELVLRLTQLEVTCVDFDRPQISAQVVRMSAAVYRNV